MKVKYSDFGRCLICCKNPCQYQENTPTQPTTNNLEGWSKEFDKFITTAPEIKEVKQFISDLRKHDMEMLIKMLPESEHSLSHIYCEEMREQGFQGCKTKVKQLIKDYYKN